MRGGATWQSAPSSPATAGAQWADPFAYADPAPHLHSRATRLAHELGLSAERILAWSLARRVESALFVADQGNVAAGAAQMRQARVLADLHS